MISTNLFHSFAGAAVPRGHAKAKSSRWFTMGAVVGAFSLLNAVTAPMASAGIIVNNVAAPYLDNMTLTSTGISPPGLFGGVGNSVNEQGGQIILSTNMGTFYTWCIDLFHVIYLGGQSTPYMAGAAVDDSGTYAGGPTVLTPAQIGTIAKLAAYGNAVMAATPSNAFSGALQAAIWNVEYGTTATGSAAFNAQLASIMAALPSLPYADGEALYSPVVGGHERQVLWHPVPEPSTVALISMALLSLFGFGMMRRRAGA